MTHSIEEIEQLEKELRERVDSADALDNVRRVERIIHPREQSPRPIHRSTRGQWESQSKGGLSLPRRKR